MTINERVKFIVDSSVEMEDGCNNATVEKMIYMAYFIGREQAAREVSDMYVKLIKEQRERANSCRFKHMANKIIGNKDYLYCSDYGMVMTRMFGNDLADV